MKNLKLLLALFIILGFQACQDDILGEPGDSTIITQDPVRVYKSGVTGIVTDSDGILLENVEVSYNNVSYYTDENGYFKIEDVTVGEDGGILFFNYPEHFENFKFFLPTANSLNFMRVELIPRELTTTVSAANGGTVNIEGGAKVVFPESAFVDENGAVYSGEVSVYTHWFDPSDPNLSLSIPGDLRAIAADGEIAQLATFGMIAVELESNTGAELQLADGKKATMEFPVPNALINSAPATIETWSLDEERVYWVEEDVADLQDGKYVTEVSHFSFWNCDAPFPVVPISGKIVDQNGDPLSSVRICITAYEGALSGYGWTGTDGAFGGKVPKGVTLTMQIKNACGEVVFEEEIGPLGTDTSLGEIVVQLSTEVTVKGRLVCSGMGVSTGYAKIISNGRTYVAEVDEDGNFEYLLLQCNIEEIMVQGFDLENARISDLLSYNTSGDVLEVGDLEVCEALDEYIIYKINGGSEMLELDPDASIQDGKLILSGTIDSVEANFKLIAPNAQISNSGEVELVEAIAVDQNWLYTYFNCGDGIAGNCNNVTIAITQIGGEGDYVRGSFMGEALDQDGNNQTIMGEFRVKIDYVGVGLSISGLSWIDVNEDGIRQTTEPSVANTSITLRKDNEYRGFVTTGSDGQYRFDCLIPGNYSLIARSSQGYALTTANVGSDDTIDSDFDDTRSDVVIVDQPISNYDIGYINNGSFECGIDNVVFPTCSDPQSGSASLYLYGIAPFDILVERLNTTETYVFDDYNDDVLTLTDLYEGVYLFTVTDALGSECENQAGLQVNTEDFRCTISVVPENCGQRDGVATATPSGGQPPYNYRWSNGETTQTITNLSVGDYLVTVTDDTGCETYAEAFIFSSEEIFAFVTQELINCGGGVTEYYLDAQVVAGSGDYTYIWSTGETGSSILYQHLIGNPYPTVEVIDNLTGCSYFEEVFLEEFDDSIFGYVWIDEPGGTENIYDFGSDTPLEGVEVQLFLTVDPMNPIDVTTTTNAGTYWFNFAPEGDLFIRFIAPVNAEFVLKDQGTNDSVDSDADPATGDTDSFYKEPCITPAPINAGFTFN